MKSLDTTAERLQNLLRRKSQLDARIKLAESKQSSQSRKNDTRLKVLIGAACLADSSKNSSTGVFIREVLSRSIQKANDREFLIRMGWLDGKK